MPRIVICCLASLLLLCTACATTGDESSGWNRSYAATYDEVWAAAAQAVKKYDMVIVDEDRDRGRLRTSGRSGSLELQIEQRGEIVVVDALAASVMDSPMHMGNQGSTVRAVLNEVSRILRENPPQP